MKTYDGESKRTYSGTLLSTSVQSSRPAKGRCSKYFRSFCIPFKGAILVLVWSALIHSFGTTFYATLFFVSFEIQTERHSTGPNLQVITTQSALMVTLLLYPLAGLLAETLFTRIKFMIAATVVAIIGLIIVTVSTCCFLITVVRENTPFNIIFSVVGIIGLIIFQIGEGMFEANVIQFGVDQLQFSSNEELPKFVHWYFFTKTVVQYTPGIILSPILSFADQVLEGNLILTVQAILGLLSTIIALILSCSCRHYLLIEPTSTSNPVTLICKVLNYAIHHSQPMRRSAFTYGEPHPSRLDIAKERYGGPFTTEQVEDVKSFWKIFGILMTLFAASLPYVQLVHDPFANDKQSFNTTIPTDRVISNDSIFYITFIVVIPLYLCLLKPCLSLHPFRRLTYITLLRKMGIGITLTCTALILVTVSSSMRYEYYTMPSNSSCCGDNFWSPSSYTIITLTPSSVAQIFSGLGYMLVFLTAQEFILAQAPRTMQGLLIGLWYAYQSIGLAAFLIIEATQVKHYWPYIVLTVLSALSVCLYSIVSYRFKYRQRQESTNVNYRYIIEEYTTRHLEEQELIQREKELLTVDDYNIID